MIDHTDLGDLPADGSPGGGPEVLHYVHDILGSVVALVDQGDPGASPPIPLRVVERYTYDPYGRTVIEQTDPTTGESLRDPQTGEPTGRLPASRFGNPFAWTAQRYDAGVGLYHFLFRSYSPGLGRWLQRDPLGYVESVSLYEYVGSRPLEFVDPAGLQSRPVRQPPTPPEGTRPATQPVAPPTRSWGPHAVPASRGFVAGLKPGSYPRPGPLTPPLGPGVFGFPRYPNNPNAPTNGCSVPGYPGSAPSGVDFTPACNEHDRCYSTPGKDRFQCDKEFYDDMIRLCIANSTTDDQLGRCLIWAQRFFWAVRLKGAPYYRRAQCSAAQSR